MNVCIWLKDRNKILQIYSYIQTEGNALSEQLKDSYTLSSYRIPILCLIWNTFLWSQILIKIIFKFEITFS